MQGCKSDLDCDYVEAIISTAMVYNTGGKLWNGQRDTQLDALFVKVCLFLERRRVPGQPPTHVRIRCHNAAWRKGVCPFGARPVLDLDFKGPVDA